MKLLLFAVIVTMLPTSAWGRVAKYRHLRAAQITALKEAIEDEIYDYHYYDRFYQLGENIGSLQHWVARIQLFINPLYDTGDRGGQVIYKFMPFGQIYRFFYIEENGSIKLDGDPSGGFPPSQPSSQTVFMNEDDVCRLMRTWRKTSIVIDTEPTREMIQRAAQRQKIRKGFSDWEYRQSRQDLPKK